MCVMNWRGMVKSKWFPPYTARSSPCGACVNQSIYYGTATVHLAWLHWWELLGDCYDYCQTTSLIPQTAHLISIQSTYRKLHCASQSRLHMHTTDCTSPLQHIYTHQESTCKGLCCRLLTFLVRCLHDDHRGGRRSLGRRKDVLLCRAPERSLPIQVPRPH